LEDFCDLPNQFREEKVNLNLYIIIILINFN
jgi:hypothetical protein